MKKFLSTMVIVGLLLPTISQAGQIEDQARKNFVFRAGGFGLGWLTGFAAHELGHEVTSRIVNTPLHWNWDERSWTIDEGGHSLRTVAMGGFAAQIISTEILLNYDKIPKDDAFVLGWLTFNVVNALSYTLKDVTGLQDGKPNDFQAMRDTGMDTTWFQVGLVAHSLWTAYRMYNHPDIPVWFSTTGNSFVVGFTWKF